MSDEQISDEELAAFLAAHGDIHIPAASGHTRITSESEALWARVHDTERRLSAVEWRASWLLAFVLTLAAALGVTELSLAIASLSSR